MDILPRWAYHENEWKELIMQADKIVNGIFYKLPDPPEPPDGFDFFINDILGE